MLKKNVLCLAAMGFVLAGGAMACLMFGSFALEIQLLLVSIASAFAGGALVLGGQIASDPPPNPHREELNHQYRMAQLEVDAPVA